MSASETMFDLLGTDGNTKITRAVFDATFEGRFFAVGNPHIKEAWGKVGTFNEAYDELMRDISCGNAGNGMDVVETDAEGNFIK